MNLIHHLMMSIHFAKLVEPLFKMPKAAAQQMNLLIFLIRVKPKPVTILFGETKTVGNGSKSIMGI